MVETFDEADVGLELAKIALRAADIILPLWRTELEVSAKHDKSPVTEADRRAEALILEALAERFTGIPVVSEEDASEFGTPDEIGPIFFLVDPLDGTKAFVRGDPHFTVNIALIRDGVPIAGAVAAPASGEVWGTSARGVIKRHGDGPGEIVRTRPWPKGAALALVSHTMKTEIADELQRRYGYHRSERMDSSIKFCRIAEGAADVYPRLGPTMEWDTAAGHAVLVCAGGDLTTPEGGPFLYGKTSEGFRNGNFVARSHPTV
jgi:3'(2'), 5'-bisphosphate nucleotidase